MPRKSMGELLAEQSAMEESEPQIESFNPSEFLPQTSDPGASIEGHPSFVGPSRTPDAESLDFDIDVYLQDDKSAAPPRPEATPSSPGRGAEQPSSGPSSRTLGDKTQIAKSIVAAAKKHGVDPARLLALAMHESKLDPSATNKKSGAKGIFQALPAWAEQYGVKGMEYNVEAVADAAARSLKGTSHVSNPYLSYLVHNQGRKGAEQILLAAVGEAPLPARIKKNMLAQPIFKDGKGSDQDMAKAFIAMQRKRFMKHYKEAQSMVGEREEEERMLAGSPARNIDWDGLISRATGEAQGAVGQTVLSQMGPAVPRKTFGGKVGA